MTEKLHTSRRTPLDANYEACESTYVELLIYSDGESSLITESLGIKPSYAQNKGELIENSRGITRKAKMTYWSLSSEGRVLSKDVRHHLIWLLDQLHGKEFVLARLQQQGISMTVNCNWWSSGSGGPTLWPEQMSALAKFNLECTFDIYCSD